jgi:CRISPR-associated protein Csx10
MTQTKKRIQLTITALSPLAIGREKPGGSVNEVEKYIPGSVIRGAVAKEILSRYPEMEMQNLETLGENNHFKQLFLDENPAIFQNAYPAIAKVDDGYKKVENAPIKVLPATAVSSKANPGFITDKKHGVFDTLIDGFCADTFNHPYDPSSLKALTDNVDPRVEAFSCFYSKDGNKYSSHAVASRLLTRVGINRRRATAAEDILYSIEVLNEEFKTKNNQDINKSENYIYCSDIFVPNESLCKKLRDFINHNKHLFRLGGSISRGLGKVKIEAKETQTSNNIKPRIDRFNNVLKMRFQKWSNVFGQPKNDPFDNKRKYFTINLQSEAILLEDWQRITVISTEMLKQFTGMQDKKDDSLKLHAAYSSYDYRSGWNAAWGLMKDVELITNKGSVYLFSTQNPALWYEKLFNLELTGVGERTSEGFGQVEICNEFHLVFREQAV